MRRRLRYLLVMFLVAFPQGCDRELADINGAMFAVEFALVTVASEPATKVDVVEELSSFNVLATTLSTGSELLSWSGTATKHGDVYTTDRYWPASNPGWKFSMSNVPVSFHSSGATVSVDGTTDVVCCYMADAEYKERNAPVFRHVLSRVGSVRVNTQPGFEVSSLSATLLSVVTEGTYNLKTQSWTELGEPEDIVLGVSEGGTDNDVWVVPGDYFVRVDYTLSRDYTLIPEDYSATFSHISAVTLAPGRINNLSADAVGGDAPLEVEVVFEDLETAWGWTSDVNLENGVMNTAGDVSVFVFGDNLLGRNDPEYIVSEHSVVLGNNNFITVSVPTGHNIYAVSLTLTATDGTLVLGIPSYADFSCTPSPNIGGSFYEGKGRLGQTAYWIADTYSWTECEPAVNSLTFATAGTGGSRRFTGIRVLYGTSVRKTQLAAQGASATGESPLL